MIKNKFEKFLISFSSIILAVCLVLIIKAEEDSKKLNDLKDELLSDNLTDTETPVSQIPTAVPPSPNTNEAVQFPLPGANSNAAAPTAPSVNPNPKPAATAPVPAAPTPAPKTKHKTRSS